MHPPQKSVLIVEDSEPIRTTFRLALEWEGYRVFTAANGEEALNLLKYIPSPGLILLDLAMPVMDGEEFLSRREQDPALTGIPTIVLTAAGNPTVVPGAKKVVAKPVELLELLELTAHYCRAAL